MWSIGFFVELFDHLGRGVEARDAFGQIHELEAHQPRPTSKVQDIVVATWQALFDSARHLLGSLAPPLVLVPLLGSRVEATHP